jgi:F5/8 type C domain.
MEDNKDCVSCQVVDDNPLTQPCADDDTGSNPTVPTAPPACDTAKVPGLNCPTTNACDYWELVNSPEACIISDYIEENIVIGGAILNVHKLLGVYEQDSLQDVTGLGEPISGGDHPNFPSTNAFDAHITEWRSAQTGSDVVTSAYIGYDFGPIKLNNGRMRYGIDTFIKHDISTIRIKQGCDAENRVTKVRVERSQNGEQWFGVKILNVQDCDGMVTLTFNKTVPSRYWRIRPLAFNGGNADSWIVQGVQLVEREETNVSNIQDKIFLENRDRQYNQFPIRMKCAYTPIDVQANASKYGFMMEDVYILEVPFSMTVAKLGRPFVIGDIVQLPSETQYTPTLQARLKYLEVLDVAWSTNGYTPTWVPTLQRLIAKPALSSQETKDIFGKMTKNIDNSGLWDNDDGNNTKIQDLSDITQTIKAKANTMVPQDGTDFATAPELSDEFLEYGRKNGLNVDKFNRRGHPHGQDAMPPNGHTYTQADTFPVAPKNGEYHRLTYTHINKDLPARLYRYSTIKNSWIFLEMDNRHQLKNSKSLLEEFKTGNHTGIPVPSNKVDENL